MWTFSLRKYLLQQQMRGCVARASRACLKTQRGRTTYSSTFHPKNVSCWNRKYFLSLHQESPKRRERVGGWFFAICQAGSPLLPFTYPYVRSSGAYSTPSLLLYGMAWYTGATAVNPSEGRNQTKSLSAHSEQKKKLEANVEKLVPAGSVHVHSA